MSTKLGARAGSDAYRRTFVDCNRILKITDRRFHAAWEEMRGAKGRDASTSSSERQPTRQLQPKR